AMDGYALRGAELATTASTRLRVVGVCYAGQAGWDAPIPAQACVRIMTGAVMPADLDTVVPVEMVRAGRDEHGDWIEVPADAVRPGE
ncbi:UNVERIFIED_CONTAM: molybdopterin molybdenumtransferase MoeA, partial [Salmonella enterica subsp. enterica serovar Weltevreden]